MKFIGLDAGSVSVKVTVLDETCKRLSGYYRKHMGNPLEVALKLLNDVTKEGCEFSLSVTGSNGRLIASILGIEPVNEIVVSAYSTRRLYPHIRSIIELGGEDSKLIILTDSGIKDFSMNSVCAAGTGSFLDQQAERLLLSIEEFSELSLKAEKPARIAGRCSVFAKSDMIHLQQIATPMEDIVAGLCFAVARNFKGSIAKGRETKEPLSFQGGVAANKGMVRAFKEVFELQELFVPPDFALMGAWGACLKAYDEKAINRFDLNSLRGFLKNQKVEFTGHQPLIKEDDSFLRRHSKKEAEVFAVNGKEKIRAYMGIDVGSISTNLAVIDDEGRLLGKRYLMTAGRPIEAVREGLRGIADELRDKVIIMGVGTTGSGRYMTADYVGADIVKNEITAQATASAFIDKTVDTIFEIGGQDSKFISLRDGVIVDFEMNKACAAGTGSFLEEQAEKLDISIKDEFAEIAFSSASPLRLGERCTVFMENSLMANLGKGAKKEDLLAGLAYSIVQNYINRVVVGKHIGENIFFQGGVAFNKSVVSAFEKYLGKNIIVPPHHDVTGAIGMALIAKRHCLEQKFSTSSFKGFGLSETPYTVSSFECKGCPNICEINRIKIEGEKGYLFYGGRCEKYDVRRKKSEKTLPDLFSFREEMLWNGYKPEEQKAVRGLIGIPYIFHFHDELPFWVTLLRSLGFGVEVSPRTNRNIINIGLESVVSEACFPVKVSHGHIKYLMERGVSAILIPSHVNLNSKDDEFPKGSLCPHAQTIPYVSRVALEGLRPITPIIDKGMGKGYIVDEIKRVFKEFSLKKKAIEDAVFEAEKAQIRFESAIKEKGREILEGLKDKMAAVIVGRPYNSFDRGVNLEIPEKLANLGIASIPMDLLPIEDIKIRDNWPNMYWRSGQRILKTARFLSKHPNLYPIYIGNFSCGPDSFILKYFKMELRGKPFLHIEIDEHSADAGAITRLEAFLDSISGRTVFPPKMSQTLVRGGSTVQHSVLKRTVYIPCMSDHAFALESAFQLEGLPTEVLPPSDKETLNLGMRYVSGKECYPCVVTTGDMLKKVFSKDFIPERSAFFMPSGTGPCRFGQYNVFHRQVLESLGLQDVLVISPTQDIEFYKDLGIIGKDFTANSWKGIIAIELLYKCLHETRPYERQKGYSDELYRGSLNKICLALKGRKGKIENVLKEIKREFSAIPRYKERKPLIGVVGEIFVRSNRFSNEDLIRKIESLGGEVWLAPVEEWLYYVNYIARKRALLKRDISAIVGIWLKGFFQKRIEHRYAGCFEGFLRTLKEPSTKEILKKASSYVHPSFEGETVLSMGKAVDLALKEAGGIVNAMPFGCMPGTIVTALMLELSRHYNIPAISIPYDGTESPTVLIQLEAFMEQAKGS